MIGIYAIVNRINGKMYIGQSIDIEKRWREHKSELKNNKHDNDYLQKSWNKYGKDNFTFIILENTTIDYINDAEIYWINYFDSTNKTYGYNLKNGGSNGSLISSVREKISIKLKGTKRTQESCLKISKAKKRTPMKEETKIKLSQANTGKKRTEVQIKKMEQAAIDNNGMRGKKHTDEAKEKMRNWKRDNYKGEGHPQAKITEKDALKIINLLLNGVSAPDIAKIMNTNIKLLLVLNIKIHGSILRKILISTEVNQHDKLE